MAERIRKGDRVAFKLGRRSVEGVVKELRGPIGVQGRSMFRIEFSMGSEVLEPSFIELPEDELELVKKPASV